MPKDIVEQSFLHGNARKTSPGLVWSRILEECVQVGTYAFFCLWLLVFMLHNSLWASRFFHATWNLFRHLPLVDMAAVCERFGRKSIDHGKNSRLQDGLVNFWLYTHLGHASGDWRSLLLLLRVFRKSLWAICFPCRNETCSSLTCVKNLWFCDTELDQVSHGLWPGAFFLQFWQKILYNRSNFTTLLTAPKGF